MIIRVTFITGPLRFVPDVRVCTIAVLSTLNITWLCFHRWPHRMIACSTAYISLNWMSRLRNRWGHLAENQWSSKVPPRPFDPLASVYMFLVGFFGSSIWIPFHDLAYVSHRFMSALAYAGTCLLAKLDWKVIEKLISLRMNVHAYGIT